MQKISDSTSTANALGEFTEGNPGAGVDATLLKAAWLNAIQRELVALVEATGTQLDPADDSQLLKAILGLKRLGDGAYSVDTGEANTYKAAYNPAVSELLNGMVLRFRATHGNTNASTFAPDGLPPAPITGSGHSPLQGHEIAADADVWLQWNDSINSGVWVLIACAGGSFPTAKARKTNHAVTLGQLQDDLRGCRRVTTSGTFTVPDNVTTLYISACAGGGGGGGGAGNTTIGAAGSCGGGGGAGEFVTDEPIAVTPGQVIQITIGAEGSGGGAGTQSGLSATPGSDGGDTVIGELLTLAGGKGGEQGINPGTGVSAGGLGGDGFPKGGSGSDGSTAVNNAGWPGASGAGASSPFGGGGPAQRSGIYTADSPVFEGIAAAGFGAGGGGGAATYTGIGPGGTGGDGSPGFVTIKW